jgi:hypothetical protein
MIWSIAQAASPAANSEPVVKRPRTCGHDEIEGSPEGWERGAVTARSSHARHDRPTPISGPGKTCCDQFRPWLYLNNYKASYFIL